MEAKRLKSIKCNGCATNMQVTTLYPTNQVTTTENQHVFPTDMDANAKLHTKIPAIQSQAGTMPRQRFKGTVFWLWHHVMNATWFHVFRKWNNIATMIVK